MKKLNIKDGVSINAIALALGILSCFLAYQVLKFTNDVWAGFYTLCGCLLVFVYVLDKMVNEGD